MGKRNKAVKLTPRKIRYIIRAKIRNQSTKSIAADMKISQSTVKRVWMYYHKNHDLLPLKKFGRPKKAINEEDERLILKVHKEQNLGARRLEAIIEFKYGRRIPHNSIHHVLLEHGLANQQKNKKRRRKPWIRYERDHSLTAVHLDWHISDFNGKEVCAVLDDCSRKILAGGEFDVATAEASILLLKKAMKEYATVGKIQEVITDRGTQFYANKKDKSGEGNSKFATFLEKAGVTHIKARVNHPQTNGKIEKWYDTYEKNRINFENFDIFVNWYNTVRFHESLDTKHYLQTPEDAFWSRLPQESVLKVFLNRMEAGLNAKT
ncbi:MAG: IS481 family transposase [Methanotrichaceae archaeon]|nr:IS481 family transposase [Methanotrichaceae archaeon]